MADSAYPTLPPSIEIFDQPDIDDVWQRFEVFEALHRGLTICNPLVDSELNEVLEALAPEAGDRMLDVACGYGEVLIRCAARAQIMGTGIDLSPWMVVEAHRRATDRVPTANLRWVLGEARDFSDGGQFDVVTCLGAEWIWHDFNGTARAVAALITRGGRIAIGAPRLHLDADPAESAAGRGRIETVDQMSAKLSAHGLRELARVDPDDAGWDAYLDSTADAARRWARDYPGEKANRYLAEQADWNEARERDRAIIGWSVWVAEKL